MKIYLFPECLVFLHFLKTFKLTHGLVYLPCSKSSSTVRGWASLSIPTVSSKPKSKAVVQKETLYSLGHLAHPMHKKSRNKCYLQHKNISMLSIIMKLTEFMVKTCIKYHLNCYACIPENLYSTYYRTSPVLSGSILKFVGIHFVQSLQVTYLNSLCSFKPK